MSVASVHATLSTSSRSLTLGRRTMFSAALLGVGCLLNALAYESFQPLMMFAVIFAFGLTLLLVTPLGGIAEIAIFQSSFAVGWFMAGIAAIYANLLNDPFQNGSDAATFYELATTISNDSTLAYISRRSEGAASVLLWKWVYDFFAMLGFEKGRYIGVLVNTLAVAMAGVIALKMAKLLYGKDWRRLALLIRIYVWCGVFWLFAAIHIRDAVVMFAVCVLAYMWVRYLKHPTAGNLLALGSGTLIGFGVFGLLRGEFIFVPAAMLAAGLAAIILFDKSKGMRKIVVYAVALAGLAVAAVLAIALGDQLMRALEAGQDFYSKTAQAEGDSGSLGARLLSLPLPLKLIFGSGYLFVFPIPVWIGFQLESAYHLFKSFNALYFYALTPLFALAILDVIRDRVKRTASMMFLLFLVMGFTVAVAGTSVETRHFGTFLVPLMVFSVQPDFSRADARRGYRFLLMLFVGAMFMVHAAWAVLKGGA